MKQMKRKVRQIQTDRCVWVSILRLPGSTATGTEILRDIQFANNIWGATCRIRFDVLSIRNYTAPDGRFGTDELDCGRVTNKMVALSRKIHRNPPVPPPGNRPFVVVLYSGGSFRNVVRDENGTIGCTTITPRTNNTPLVTIFITPRLRQGVTDRYLLAHELGHALYISRNGRALPQPNPFPGDPIHHRDPNNLMYPVVPQNSVLSRDQCPIARASFFTFPCTTP